MQSLNKSPGEGTVIFITALLINLFVTIEVYQGDYSTLLPLLWLSSIGLLAFSARPSNFRPQINKLPPLSKKTFLAILIILLPVIVRIANYNLGRIHGDDLITGYFSARYSLTQDNFFAPVPADKDAWVAQFPAPFFVLQKLFFLAFGESLITIKLSIIPYVLIVSWVLFLITKEAFGEKTAVASLILYAFLSPSLYLETLGLHFISSTAVFMIFFYLLIRTLKQPAPARAALTGTFCGLCYLFYLTSFIALPIMLIAFSLQLWRGKKIRTAQNFTLSLVAFFLILSPFLAYAYQHNNYFPQRFKQVELTAGEWSGAKNRIARGESRSTIIGESLQASIKSFYQDGILGSGGYDFGHLAFLEIFSQLLLASGLGFSLVLFAGQPGLRIPILLVWLTVFSSLAAVVLSMAPPGFHRFSLAFPFLAIMMSVPFYFLLSAVRLPRNLKYGLVLLLLASFAINNQRYFEKTTATENSNPSLRLASLLEQNYPHRNIYVAAYPNFALEKFFYFTPLRKQRKIETDYHNNLLARLNPHEKYLYVILFPKEFEIKFKKADPYGRIIKFSQDYSLFAN